MGVFADKTGQQWQLELPIAAVSRVKSGTAGRINLLHPEGIIDGMQLQVLLQADPLEMWEVLFYIVEPQCQQRGISAADFGELMSAECLLHAEAVFWQEWTDFFRNLQRPDVALALEKMKVWMATGKTKLKTMVAKIPTQTMDSKVMKQLDDALNAAFGNLRESLELTPDAIPGDSSMTCHEDAPDMIG